MSKAVRAWGLKRPDGELTEYALSEKFILNEELKDNHYKVVRVLITELKPKRRKRG